MHSPHAFQCACITFLQSFDSLKRRVEATPTIKTGMQHTLQSYHQREDRTELSTRTNRLTCDSPSSANVSYLNVFYEMERPTVPSLFASRHSNRQNLIAPVAQEVLERGQQEVPWLRRPGFEEFQEVFVLCGMSAGMRRVCVMERSRAGFVVPSSGLTFDLHPILYFHWLNRQHHQPIILKSGIRPEESVMSPHTPRVFFNSEVNDSDLCETLGLLLPCGLVKLTEMNDMSRILYINPTHPHAKPEENKLQTNCVERDYNKFADFGSVTMMRNMVSMETPVQESNNTRMEREFHEIKAKYDKLKSYLNDGESCNLSVGEWTVCRGLFYFIAEKHDWSKSRDLYISKGADLVIITSQNEQVKSEINQY
ncbi:hypothetical protein E1301_Tti018092 [Triplophysa tibetana]|uniref:Uncharacterized protein n=1 Tax=Triplophysa tibetana TaxID=1572043 RepID=A0A5A9NP49_9TELE|nr:hypothetical protein E1301_Tti018092 [Triplophysa tibetana]